MGIDPMQFLLNKALNDPRIANNPQAKEWLKVIQTNDSTKGEQIAQNILNSYGLSKDEAMKQAMAFFNLS